MFRLCCAAKSAHLPSHMLHRPVQAHKERVGEERCALVRAMVFANKSMASRGNLAEQARRWLDEAGTTPPGNGVERELWEARPSCKPEVVKRRASGAVSQRS